MYHVVECIMLSKKFFIEHANEQVKKLIRYQVRPYPIHTTLQENLQTQVKTSEYCDIYHTVVIMIGISCDNWRRLNQKIKFHTMKSE